MDVAPEAFKPEFETDLKKIGELVHQNGAFDLEFSHWLKTQNPSTIDQLVKDISTTVSAGIDCVKCSNCCKSLIVGPNYQDVGRLADHLEIPHAEFKKKYLKKDFEGELVFKQKPCSFLKNTGCSVYQERPGLCRKYPYLDQGNILPHLGRLLANLSVCPIVFNTYELLKLKFS
jgi:Fe-S-cluster containining protein